MHNKIFGNEVGTLLREIRIRSDVLEPFLELCKEFFPKENIMLIRGKIKNGVAEVKEFLIPPFSTYGHGFSGFSTYMLPFDLSIIGIAHSHPSGNASPSDEDLNSFYGRVMIIAGYPYTKEKLCAYDARGERILIIII